MLPVTFSWLGLVTTDPLNASIQEGGVDMQLMGFPVDQHGVPLSDDLVFNACIRNQVVLDDEGNPYNCKRYHPEDNIHWTHPTLGVTFVYDQDLDPALTLPEGWTAVTVQEASDEEPVEETPADTSKEEELIPETPVEEESHPETPVETTPEEPASEETPEIVIELPPADTPPEETSPEEPPSEEIPAAPAEEVPDAPAEEVPEEPAPSVQE